MLKTIEAASGRPVSVAEAKEWCRVDHDHDDDTIEGLLDAAIEFVSERTGLVLAPTVFRFDRSYWWGGNLNLLVAPVRAIREVSYFDEANAAQTVDAANYSFTRTPEGARLELLSTYSVPAVYSRNDAIQVEIEAGFDSHDPVETGSGDDPELLLPERVRQVIRMLVSFWYDNRDAVTSQDTKVVPLGAEALLAQLRVYR